MTYRTRKSFYPRKCEAIKWIEKDSRVILLDPREGRYYKLNGTAALIWGYCDGTNDSDTITRLLRSAFPAVGGKKLKNDVEAIISDLHRKRLIDFKRRGTSRNEKKKRTQ